MKKTALIMKILTSTNFKFFLHFEKDIFFNLEELIEQKCENKFFAFEVGLETKKHGDYTSKIYFYTLSRVNTIGTPTWYKARVKAWDEPNILLKVLTIEKQFEDFHKKHFSNNKYVIEYLKRKEKERNGSD